MDQRRHLPGLDGVRGVAIALVVIGHIGLLPRQTVAGGAGVAVFFVLSGYLITTALRRGGPLVLFYGARAARLVPALMAAVLGIGAIWLVQGRPPAQFAGSATRALLYVENLVGGHGESVLAHTWSLAVEEQFYLLWPLVLPFLVRRPARTRAALICGAIVVSLGLRLAFVKVGWDVQAVASLPTNACALLAGCALALLGVPVLRPGPALAGGFALVAGGLAAGLVVPRPPVVVPIVAALGAVLLVVAGVGGAGPLTWRPLRLLGDVSYSWYLWHWPLLWLFDAQFRPWPGTLVVAAALPVAWASTTLLEQPIRGRYRAWQAVRGGLRGPATDPRDAVDR